MVSGRGAAWLARLLGVQEVPSSNLGGPTKYLKELQAAESPEMAFWHPDGVQNGRQRHPRGFQGSACRFPLLRDPDCAQQT